jgi:hypothetical protein
MSDDLLERAARALREETEADSQGNQFARARVLASLHHARLRRHKRFVFMAPFGLVFAAASAWGMASGRAPELARQIGEALGLLGGRAPQAAPAHAPAPSPAAPPETKALEPAPSAEPEPELGAPEPTPAAPVARRVSPRPAQRAPAPRPHPTGDLPPPGDPGHELYRAAHQAHFVERDPARALRGWDAYLAQARGGRFALEARYNRALCLIRLGRRAEAKRALEAFARGDFGTYRQGESARLLEALSRGPTRP